MLRSSITARRLATRTSSSVSSAAAFQAPAKSVSSKFNHHLFGTTASTTTNTTTSTTISGSSASNSNRIHRPGTSIRSLSSYSSFREPSSLFETAGTTIPGITFSVEQAVTDRDAPLRADVRTMGSLLGQIIQDHHGEATFNKIEELRSLAKAWRDAGAGRKENADAQFAKLAEYCTTLSNEELHIISRAFTHFLAIANAAEGHHRSRLLSSMMDSENALPSKSDSCGGVLESLMKQNHDSETIYQALTSQKVELVLTAHPTEVNRRTILEKQRRVQEILTKADALRGKSQITSYAQSELDRALTREIASLWQSDEVSRSKPSPQNEAERGTLVVETVMYEALPSFLRKLNATMLKTLGKSLPLEASPVIFSSWMGGDRDGNPNVRAETTREVCLKQRAQAAGLLARDLSRLKRELSLTNCSNELRTLVGEKSREPYRSILKLMVAKLQNTQLWAEEQLENQHHQSSIEIEDIYLSRNELMKDLLLIHRSLCEQQDGITADGLLTDVIRNVASFGLTMVTLDIRQESDRHEEAVDCITRFLGLGSYSQWDEDTKLNWLQQQLASKRPLLRPGVWTEHPDLFPPTAVDTLETFAMISEQYEDSLGAYVISQATSASDVLAVLLLQKDAGVKNPLRVVPLFETLDDLNGAADTMKKLFSLPGYMGQINGKQEVMIGYSDSAKDAGRLAASWAQYETQEALAKVARDAGVALTFFHGKGGTVGRGGNPQTFLAILAHAPDTINGQFRVTEQGEMINQNFGYVDRAERTMDIYTAAVLAEKLTERTRPTPEWRDMMKKLSDISCDAYRKIVSEDERFVPYFRSATPELELSSLNIGSRPAKRKASGGVESLRAIPWIFAWTQTRLNLPTWLGVGEAINGVLKSEDADKLREMYKEWGSFRTTVDLVEMVLAKSEPTIAAHYDAKLVKGDKATELGKEVRALHMSTEDAILDLTEHSTLSENNLMLQRLLQVRNPYCDCLNVLQVETLTRIRSVEEGKEDKVLKDALLTTITGIANGMGNTG